jgi:hypothetical protein
VYICEWVRNLLKESERHFDIGQLRSRGNCPLHFGELLHDFIAEDWTRRGREKRREEKRVRVSEQKRERERERDVKRERSSKVYEIEIEREHV